jgi:hypothetical protein
MTRTTTTTPSEPARSIPALRLFTFKFIGGLENTIGIRAHSRQEALKRIAAVTHREPHEFRFIRAR